MTEKPFDYGIDEEKNVKYQFVKIVNPITLGIQIGVGMLIMLPLLVIATLFLLMLFVGMGFY